MWLSRPKPEHDESLYIALLKTERHSGREDNGQETPCRLTQRIFPTVWDDSHSLVLPCLTSIDSTDPPFLQKLRSQQGGTGGLERPIARPRISKRNDNDDDEPTYVDEESHEVISKDEYKALVQDSNQQDTAQEGDKGQDAPGSDEKDTTDNGKGAPVSKQKLAEIGGPKKRKQAKVVGEENTAKAQEGEDEGEAKEKPQEAPSKKPKQKKKKIKLSFDEE